MLFKIKYIVVFFFSVAVALITVKNSVAADDGCVFDSSYYSSLRYTNQKSVAGLLWNESEKTVKIITIAGGLVSVKHWACDHIGLEAKELVHPILNQKELDVVKEVLEFGELVLDKKDFDSLKERVYKVNSEHGINLVTDRIDVQSSGYSEFYVSIKVLEDVLLITIKLYKD